MNISQETLPFSVPAKQVSAWVAETDPKSAQEWISHLPMADVSEASREIYQAIYTLNRLKLNPSDRFKLLELYREPVKTITASLKAQYQKNVFPLNERKRQLAEFVRELQMEMAHGYKCTIIEAEKARFMWGKKELKIKTAANAMRYLGEVLKCSYEVYMSCPPMVWHEIHGIYQYVERLGWLEYKENGETISPIVREYMINLLMGSNNPYQLPEHELEKVSQFLSQWAHLAEVSNRLAIGNTAGHFLVDLTSDAPPAPFPGDVNLEAVDYLRALNALGIVKKIQDSIGRLKRGIPVADLNLGVESLDADCLEMLKRMMRNWGLAVKRSSSRIKVRSDCFVASGIRAIHYFSSGQTPFVSPDQSQSGQAGSGRQSPVEVPDASNPAQDGNNADYIDLDSVGSNSSSDKKKTKVSVSESVFRVEQWRIADESAGGMKILHDDTIGAVVRVGDLLGVQDRNNSQAWRIGAARWLKTPSKSRVEVGLEMLSPDASPVAIRFLGKEKMDYSQALLVPPMPALKRPATLIMPAGFFMRDKPFELVEADGTHRKIKSLELLERTNSYEHIVFADMASDKNDDDFSLTDL